jgi:hypothetical protein
LTPIQDDFALAHASTSEQSRCEHAHSPHDSADERFIQQKDEKPRAISFINNFARIHRMLKTTPTRAAGVTDRLWEVANMVDLLKAREPQN